MILTPVLLAILSY